MDVSALLRSHRVRSTMDKALVCSAISSSSFFSFLTDFLWRFASSHGRNYFLARFTRGSTCRHPRRGIVHYNIICFFERHGEALATRDFNEFRSRFENLGFVITWCLHLNSGGLEGICQSRLHCLESAFSSDPSLHSWAAG